MNNAQASLYRRLCGLEITPQAVALSFEARLARENGWDLSQAILVDQEYRKFLFLMLEAGHPVTPSDQVDQAWHLHLIYTRSYWHDLCEKIAGRPLHHGPTAGGQSEREKFTDWYAKTKQSYRAFFDEDPPIELWPSNEIRFGEDVQYRRVNTARNVVLPSPRYWINRFAGAIKTKNRKLGGDVE